VREGAHRIIMIFLTNSGFLLSAEFLALCYAVIGISSFNLHGGVIMNPFYRVGQKQNLTEVNCSMHYDVTEMGQ
jgi:hypothetical protein